MPTKREIEKYKKNLEDRNKGLRRNIAWLEKTIAEYENVIRLGYWPQKPDWPMKVSDLREGIKHKRDQIKLDTKSIETNLTAIAAAEAKLRKL